jgi:two-component system, sensor histidine kinase and response regulator
MKNVLQRLLSLGTSEDLHTYRSHQIRIFNWFNIFGFIAAVIRLVYIIISPVEYTTLTMLVNILPVLLCLSMGVCMYFKRVYLAAAISFFLFSPVFFVVYAATLDSSIAMFLLLYFIFPFFFLQKTAYIIAAFTLTATSFLLVYIGDDLGLLFYSHDFYTFDITLACINFTTSIIFIFTCLYSIRDMVISYQRNISKKKKELQKLNAVKDKLFSIISHDLRSPIAATAQFLELLKETEMNKAEFDYYLSELGTTVENTRDMMDKLLTWSKSHMNTGVIKADNIPVREVVDASVLFVKRQAEAKSITISNEVNDQYCAIADKDMTNIIIHNLLVNAIKFTHHGGIVKIHSVKTADGKLSVRVSDNGVGIPATTQHRILGSEFYTTIGTAKEKGSGLGLKMCQDLAVKNNAQLSFESTEGKGSTFSLDLPLLKISIPVTSWQETIVNLKYAVA